MLSWLAAEMLGKLLVLLTQPTQACLCQKDLQNASKQQAPVFDITCLLLVEELQGSLAVQSGVDISHKDVPVVQADFEDFIALQNEMFSR